MIWFIVWLAVAALILGLFIWSTRILMEQKRAWKAYAEKYRLTYRHGRFLNASSVTGMMGGYRMTIFSESKAIAGNRGNRFMTCVQFVLPPGMPTGGVIASAIQEPLVQMVALEGSVDVQYEGWDYTVFIRAEDPAVLRPWLTAERLKVLDELNKIKGGSVIFMFDTKQTYLRFESLTPLNSPVELDRLVKRMLVACDALSPQKKTAGEAPAVDEKVE